MAIQKLDVLKRKVKGANIKNVFLTNVILKLGQIIRSQNLSKKGLEELNNLLYIENSELYIYKEELNVLTAWVKQKMELLNTKHLK